MYTTNSKSLEYLKELPLQQKIETNTIRYISASDGKYEKSLNILLHTQFLQK
jgi:hypothetical protein